MGLRHTLIFIIFSIYSPSAHTQTAGRHLQIPTTKLQLNTFSCGSAATLLSFSAIEQLLQTEQGTPSPLISAIEQDNSTQAEPAPEPTSTAAVVAPSESVADRIIRFLQDPAAGITVNWVRAPLSRYLELNLMGRLRAYSIVEGQTTRYIATTNAGVEFLVHFNRSTSLGFSGVLGAGGIVTLATNPEVSFNNNEVMGYVVLNQH